MGEEDLVAGRLAVLSASGFFVSALARLRTWTKSFDDEVYCALALS